MNKEKTHYPIITISNFKRFSKPIEFELKPITIFVGPNGSGKSTIIEALNILSKSLKTLSKREYSHKFLKEYLYDNLIGDKSKKHFEFSINHPVDEVRIKIAYKNLLGRPIFDYLIFENKKNANNPKAINTGELSLKFQFDSFTEYDLKKFEINNDAIKNNLPTDLWEDFPNHFKNLVRTYKSLYKFRVVIKFSKRIKSWEKLIISIAYGILTRNFFQKGSIEDKKTLAFFVFFIYRVENRELGLTFDEIQKITDQIFEKFQKIMDKIDGVELDLSADIFPEDVRKTSIKNCVKVVGGKVKKDFYGLAKFLLDDRISRERKDFLIEFLSKFEIADSLTIKLIGEKKPDTRFFEIILSLKGKKFNLTSLSSGGKQLIPILLESNYLFTTDYEELREFKWSIFVRQPELHLHPKLQADLAEFFLRISKESYCRAIVIETHSEHMIRKFQILIAKGQLDKDSISIYYLDGKLIKEMEFEENGFFKDPWPEGFFDSSFNLSMELLTAKRN